jgi:DNA-binding HxlR family transcriptional regulator
MKQPSPITCPVAWTLSVIGSAWTPLILRDLLLHGPRRFQDFQSSLTGIPPATLSDRLKRLEEQGIIERSLYQQYPPRAQYQLTSKGRALGPIIGAMRDWGTKYME